MCNSTPDWLTIAVADIRREFVNAVNRYVRRAAALSERLFVTS
jgi:hypothetical protein